MKSLTAQNIVVTKRLKYAIYNLPTYYYCAETNYSQGCYGVGDTIEKAIAELKRKDKEAEKLRYMRYGKELIPIGTVE